MHREMVDIYLHVLHSLKGAKLRRHKNQLQVRCICAVWIMHGRSVASRRSQDVSVAGELKSYTLEWHLDRIRQLFFGRSRDDLLEATPLV